MPLHRRVLLLRYFIMIKSINIGFFPASDPLEQTLERVKAAGFGAVELNMNEENVSEGGLWYGISDEDALKVKALLEKYGLACAGIVTDKLWQYNLTSDSIDMRAEGMKRIEKMIHLCTIVGATSVLVVPGIVDENVTYKNAYSNAQSCMKQLAPKAEAAGVLLGIEDVWNRFLLSPYEMADFVDGVDSPAVGAFFDVGNVVINSYPEYWIEILEGRITRIHVKGFNRDNGKFCYLREGTIDWKKVMNQLRAIGYDGFITVELGARDDWKADLEQIRSDLDKIFAE